MEGFKMLWIDQKPDGRFYIRWRAGIKGGYALVRTLKSGERYIVVEGKRVKVDF